MVMIRVQATVQDTGRQKEYIAHTRYPEEMV
jgi:hypothetical protein